MPGDEKKVAMASSAGAEIAHSLIVPAISRVYEEFTGERYDKNQVKALTTLKDVYKTTLPGLNVPVQWELDNENKPKSKLIVVNWQSYLKQLFQSKVNAKNFDYYIRTCADLIANFLDERQKRFIGKGASGDLIEQFFVELLLWLVHDLHVGDSSSTTLEMLDNRIAYLRKVTETPDLFKYSLINYGEHDENVVIKNLIQELMKCLAYAKKESHKETARENFQRLKSETQALLGEAARWCFYLRKQPVSTVTLKIDQFISDSEKSTTYSKVKRSHTGEMLKEFIQICGLSAFGAYESSLTTFQLCQYRYFDQAGVAQDFLWEPNRIDFPTLRDPKTLQPLDQQQVIRKIQAVLACCIRLGQLKNLIEEALVIIGREGDLWAYDDKEGKDFVLGLVYATQFEVAALRDAFKPFYESNVEQSCIHDALAHDNGVNRRSPTEGCNPNFNKAKDIHQDEIAKKNIKQIDGVLTRIETQIKQFPENAKQQVEEDKQKFYRNMKRYVYAHPDPKLRDRLQHLLPLQAKVPIQSEEKTPQTTLSSTVQQAIVQATETFDLKSKFSFKDKNHPWFLLMIAEIQSALDKINSSKTKVSGVYHQPLTGNEVSSRLATLRAEHDLMTHEYQGILDTAENFRPKGWGINFQFAWPPIRITVGWPFDRTERRLAASITSMVHRNKSQFDESVLVMKTQISSFVDKLVSGAASQLATRASHGAKKGKGKSAKENGTDIAQRLLLNLWEDLTKIQMQAVVDKDQHLTTSIQYESRKITLFSEEGLRYLSQAKLTPDFHQPLSNINAFKTSEEGRLNRELELIRQLTSNVDQEVKMRMIREYLRDFPSNQARAVAQSPALRSSAATAPPVRILPEVAAASSLQQQPF